MDMLVPYTEEAKKAIDKSNEAWNKGLIPPVLVINNPREEPVTRCMEAALGEPPSSTMVLPLIVGERIAGGLALRAEGDNRFSEEHARLYATLFVGKKSIQLKRSGIPGLAPGTSEHLTANNWPDNVRELENVIERAMILNRTGRLDFSTLLSGTLDEKNTDPAATPEAFTPLEKIISVHIRRALEMTRGRIHGPDGAAHCSGSIRAP